MVDYGVTKITLTLPPFLTAYKTRLATYFFMVFRRNTYSNADSSTQTYSVVTGTVKTVY